MLCSFFPGSPSHYRQIEEFASNQEIEIPSDKMFSLMPGLERLITESRITMDLANTIIATRRVPLELAQFLGLLAHTGPNSLMDTAQCLSPLTFSPGKFMASPGQTPGNSSGFSSPINGQLYQNFGYLSGSSLASCVNNGSGLMGSQFSSTNNSGCSSPNQFGHSSPMHQITKGISGLTTGGGSITKGTSLASEIGVMVQSGNQPLDLTMEFNQIEGDALCNNYSPAGSWYVPANFYDLKPLNLSPAQPIRIVPTPPASPNLCIIQEELQNPPEITRQASSGVTPTNEDSQFPHSHPQICLTDVQGSEITLVALSDSSRDSDDSLDANHQPVNLQGLVITEPSSDMPSITRGVGRKASLESETTTTNSSKLETENYIRRGSDKSLGFSDDSLSNDSNNLSPSQEPSTSSGFKSDSHSETGEIRLSPDSLSEAREMCYELPLPPICSNLDSSRILQLVKETLDTKMPPKGFVLNSGIGNRVGLLAANSMETSSAAAGDVPMPVDISNLSLEYSGGLQIELQVCEGRTKDSNVCGKNIIKMRRISGDQFEYGKLCQQLISSLTV